MNSQLSRTLSLAALTTSLAALPSAAVTVIDAFDNVAGNSYWSLDVSAYGHSFAMIGDDYYQQGSRTFQVGLPGFMDVYASLYGTYTSGYDMYGYYGYDNVVQYNQYSYYNYEASTDGVDGPSAARGGPAGSLDYTFNYGYALDFSQDPGLQFDFSTIDVATAFSISLTDVNGLGSYWSGVFNDYRNVDGIPVPVSYNVPFVEFATDPEFDFGQISEASFGFNTLGDGSFGLSQIGATVQPIPEPGTYALLGLGLGAVGLWMYRRRRA